MRSAAIAEWILSLVSAPDRAATTVGDLLETSSGTLAFFATILKTAAWHLVADIRDSWRGLLAYSLLGVFWGVFTALCTVTLGARLLYKLLAHVRDPDTSNFFVWMLAYFIVTGIPFMVGWGVAACSRGRELASSLILFATANTILFAIRTIIHIQNHSNSLYPGGSKSASYYLLVTCLLAGAAACRLRALYRSQQSNSNPG